MIGDNYITDGGAIDVGMRFIHIQPITGNEPTIHALTRYLAYLCARIYGKARQSH
jgi:FMN phosphatase YigB (HAD superfamily)